MSNFTAINRNPICPLCKNALAAGTPLSLHMGESHKQETEIILSVLGEMQTANAVMAFYKNLYFQVYNEDLECIE